MGSSFKYAADVVRKALHMLYATTKGFLEDL